MKVSISYFNRFIAAFLYWQKELGLTQYRVDFFHEKLDDYYAQVRVNELEKNARVSLCTELDDDNAKNDTGPESHAKHEVLHLLTNRLRWLGSSRYIERTDLEEEWESVVVRLEKALEDVKMD